MSARSARDRSRKETSKRGLTSATAPDAVTRSPTAGGPSLNEFLEQNPPRHNGKCKICALPDRVREETNAGLRNGIGYRTVEQWLTRQGFPVTYPTITNHVYSGHHETS